MTELSRASRSLLNIVLRDPSLLFSTSRVDVQSNLRVFIPFVIYFTLYRLVADSGLIPETVSNDPVR